MCRTAQVTGKEREADIVGEHDVHVVDLLAHLVDLDDTRDAVVCLGPLQQRAHRFEVAGRGAAKLRRFHGRHGIERSG